MLPQHNKVSKLPKKKADNSTTCLHGDAMASVLESVALLHPTTSLMSEEQGTRQMPPRFPEGGNQLAPTGSVDRTLRQAGGCSYKCVSPDTESGEEVYT